MQQQENYIIPSLPLPYDLETKEVLKQAVRDFDGTAIIVSHDRDFLDGLVDKVYEFANHKVREHIGGIYDYLHLHQLELQAAETTAVSKDSTPKNDSTLPDSGKSESKISYEARKEINRRIRKAERAVEETETAVASLEDEISALEAKLQNPDNASDHSLFQTYEKKKHELEQKMYEWEILTAQLEDERAQLPD